MGIDRLAAAIVLFLLISLVVFYARRVLNTHTQRLDELETRTSGLEQLAPFLLVATPFDPDAEPRHVVFRTVREAHECGEDLIVYVQRGSGDLPMHPRSASEFADALARAPRAPAPPAAS